MAQRESLLQWETEYMTREQLAKPAKHLRACEIIRHLTETANQKGVSELMPPSPSIKEADQVMSMESQNNMANRWQVETSNASGRMPAASPNK